LKGSTFRWEIRDFQDEDIALSPDFWRLLHGTFQNSQHAMRLLFSPGFNKSENRL
jgi:hypothetical protein